ncbi:Crinkler (CRN) family protein [Phytophthora palmivora]|uniref:Crinkler (CRN) family protein n=1 Tax=Phytophthora palmivora TaxID=4796 RepID=A0A2P4YML8_9STRA|nr:Crinkler (CRN) family protein [Phytophthora palmivora]
MKSLTCVVVGDGSVFVVEIEDRKKVGILKKMVKEEKMYNLPVDQFTLYVVKKGDNWLKTNDPDVTMLENGEVPKGVSDIMKKKENKMDPRYRIGNITFNFLDDYDAGEDEIHESKAKIKDGESSTGYSFVLFHEVFTIMPADEYKQFTKTIGDDKIDVLYSYLLVATKAFGEIILAEKSIVGKRVHGDGKFEFMIKRGSERLCIVKAKKTGMYQGRAQAYVGSEVLSDVEGLSTVFNIVTNYEYWWFSRIMDERVERDAAEMKFVNSIPTRISEENC